MTVVEASFKKPSSEGGSSAVRNVVARLLQVDSPNDIVKVVLSKVFHPDDDGLFHMNLKPTESNEAYKLEIIPSGPNNLPRFVQIPDITSVDWEDLVDVNPSTFVAYGTGGEGGNTGPAPKVIDGVVTEDELLDITGPAVGNVDVSRLYQPLVPGLEVILSFVTGSIVLDDTKLQTYYLIGTNPETFTGTSLFARQATNGVWDSEWANASLTPTLNDIAELYPSFRMPINFGGGMDQDVTTIQNAGVEILSYVENIRSLFSKDKIEFQVYTNSNPTKTSIRTATDLPGGQDIELTLPVESGELALKSDIVVPKPPTSGTYTLQSVDGVVSWVSS